MSSQDPYGQPPPYGAPAYERADFSYPAAYGHRPDPRPANGFAISSLVLGILAVLLFWVAAGVWLGIPAVILGALGHSRAARGEASGGGMAIAGIICGAVALVLTVALFGLLVLARVGTTTTY